MSMFALCISFAKFFGPMQSADCLVLLIVTKCPSDTWIDVRTSPFDRPDQPGSNPVTDEVFVVIVIRRFILCKVGGGPNICSGLFFSIFGFGGQWLVYEAGRSWRKLPVTLYLLLPPALLASTVKLWLKLSQEKIRFQGRPTDLLNIGEHQVCPFHNTE